MSETKNPGEKTLSVAPTKGTLTLKRGVEQGVVRQSFSHGRTKAVVVEKVKRRTVGPGEAKVEPAVDARAGARCRQGGRGARHRRNPCLGNTRAGTQAVGRRAPRAE
jgi:Bacterial translation initiation factor IF-2 associated region